MEIKNNNRSFTIPTGDIVTFHFNDKGGLDLQIKLPTGPIAFINEYLSLSQLEQLKELLLEGKEIKDCVPTFTVEAIKTAHWWKKGEQFEVYFYEADWPKEEKNERGIQFDGKGTHYRIVGKRDLFILKSDVKIIPRSQYISKDFNNVAPETKLVKIVRSTDSKSWYCNMLPSAHYVYVHRKDWPEEAKNKFDSDFQYLRYGTSELQAILKSDCAYSILDQMDVIDQPVLTSTPYSDPVNHPSHYTDGKIEVIEFIEDKKLDFLLGNAVKYISRAGKKDKAKEIEDLEKAMWYLKRKIENAKADKEYTTGSNLYA